MAESIVLERLTRVAPLGLRFWDAASGQFITDGLSVQAVPKLSGVYMGAPVPAFPNRSGTFVFDHLPGLRESEFGAGDLAYWQNPPIKKDFIVTVTDSLQRFLAFSISVQAPTQKILAFACANGKPTPLPEKQPGGSIPLYSTTGRAVPGGCAVIRTILARNPASPQPVVWAMVEAYAKTTLIARGFSDANGQVALYFPYPKFILPTPTSNRPPLTQANWPVDIKVFANPAPPGAENPDLCTAYAQPLAVALRQVSPNKPLLTQTLLFGQELVIQTSSKSELFLG